MSSDKRQKEAHKKEKLIKMESTVENKVCVFNKYGYCKYKNNCQKNMLIKIVRMGIVINLLLKIGTRNYENALKLKNANLALIASSNIMKNTPIILKWRQQ